MKQTNYTKENLINAINKVNLRYKRGLNDDDAVSKMFEIAESLKGYYVQPGYDVYLLCTDEERLNFLSNEYGYWSDEVKSFNTLLINKGGADYKNKLNQKLIEYNKRNEKTRVQQIQLF